MILVLILTLASALPLAAASDVPAIRTANTPVTLSAGQTYVIGALYPTQSGDNLILNSTQTYAAPITFFSPMKT